MSYSPKPKGAEQRITELRQKNEELRKQNAELLNMVKLTREYLRARNIESTRLDKAIARAEGRES